MNNAATQHLSFVWETTASKDALARSRRHFSAFTQMLRNLSVARLILGTRPCRSSTFGRDVALIAQTWGGGNKLQDFDTPICSQALPTLLFTFPLHLLALRPLFLPLLTLLHLSPGNHYPPPPTWIYPAFSTRCCLLIKNLLDGVFP